MLLAEEKHQITILSRNVWFHRYSQFSMPTYILYGIDTLGVIVSLNWTILSLVDTSEPDKRTYSIVPTQRFSLLSSRREVQTHHLPLW